MIEYLINGANVVFLGGIAYMAYLALPASPYRARVSRKMQKARCDQAAHELLFRNPCADYYI